MHPSSLIFIVVGILFPTLLITLEAGRRLAQRRQMKDPKGARAGVGPVEGAVFALFGLLVAFTFSSAASRYEARRDLIVEHANIIETAWRRLVLLPKEVQPEIRKNFRQYVDTVILVTQRFGDPSAFEETAAKAFDLQDKIWKLA